MADRLPAVIARWVKAMLPDFLLECTACGSRVVWDTDSLPPVGCPEIGHPVLWLCQCCGIETRHTIAGLYLAADKLHHEICLAAEVDRPTVDRVMAEIYYRRRGPQGRGSGKKRETEEVAQTAGVPRVIVEKISAAEAEWMAEHGYPTDEGRAA